MRRSNTQSLGEVLREYVEALKLKNKLKEASMDRHWKELTGPAIAKYTSKVYLSKNVLIVHLSSSVLRSEMLMQQEKIIKYMNEKLGEERIQKVIFK
ncbi:MAG: DUF721 domain-containing protein [Bacteroidetes bacterium]|jgi:predicted nucleic acid-binding Zn ribbon protein|nr:DUF721 domain-containing protein [Bacteroidota bacterium]